MSLIGIDENGNGFNPWEDKILVGSSDEDGLWVGTTCEIDFAGVVRKKVFLRLEIFILFDLIGRFGQEITHFLIPEILVLSQIQNFQMKWIR